MKTLKTVALVSGFIGLAGVLLAPPAMSAPGKGWDVFNAGQGEPIAASSQNVNTSPGGSAGKGWDMFNLGQGAPIHAANQEYTGTSSGTGSGEGWDLFNTGQGDRI